MDPPLNPFIFFPAAITNDFWILQASNPALPLNPLLYTRLIFLALTQLILMLLSWPIYK